MKIVLISTGVLPVPPVGYGGLEQIIYDLAVPLAEKGHDVHVVAPSESKLPGNVHLIDGGVCLPNAHQWEMECYEKQILPRLSSAEFKDAVWHDHSWRKMIYLAKIDNSKLNVMSTLHGMLCYQKPPPISKPSIAGISKSHAGILSAGLGIPIRFVYNGINLDNYIYNGGDRNGRYLFLARITPFKGTHVFLDLMNQLNLKGDIVGDDALVEDQEYVNRILKGCNESKNVRYWGGVPRDRASELFRQSKCYILPCTPGWEEPFGLTVIEAMASGCPVIATKSGAIPELVTQGVDGYVSDTIYDLPKYVNDEALSVITPENCRKKAEMFSRENMADGYLKLYNEVLDHGGW